MSSNLLKSEIIVSLVLIILLILFVNPFYFWMPGSLLLMMIISLIIVFAIYASFFWQENVRDEREGLHRMLAGRFAFLAGTAVLTLGVIVQTWRHDLDVWLVIALAAMIIAKIVGLIYGRNKY